MLILTRGIGGTVVIGDSIRITILGTKGGQVRVGFDVPREIEVHREEVRRRVRREGRGADRDRERRSNSGNIAGGIL